MKILRPDSKFISPLSDFGFKNLFSKGTYAKENLIYLLNEILKEYPYMSPIVDIEYKDTENQADNPNRKSTRFDIYCKTETGEIFVIEMQNESDPLIKHRLVFYLCQAVTEQDTRGKSGRPWDYRFPPIIVIMLCNFIDKEIDSQEVNYFGFLNTQTYRPLGNHVGLVMMQLPLFPDIEDECMTELEKIIYSLRNMETIQKQERIPFSTHKGDFYDRIARRSQTAALSGDELHEYHQWLKVTNDDLLRLQRAEEEGVHKGELFQAWKTAEIMARKNSPVAMIAEFTGLRESEIRERFPELS